MDRPRESLEYQRQSRKIDPCSYIDYLDTLQHSLRIYLKNQNQVEAAQAKDLNKVEEADTQPGTPAPCAPSPWAVDDEMDKPEEVGDGASEAAHQIVPSVVARLEDEPKDAAPCEDTSDEQSEDDEREEAVEYDYNQPSDMSDDTWADIWDPFGYLRALDVWWPLKIDDIKDQYRRLLLIHHPDKGGKKEDFVLLRSAFTYLSQPQLRADYHDMCIRAWDEWRQMQRLFHIRLMREGRVPPAWDADSE
jgi:hypothetical protein